jgi:anthranilate phosphoribosyltransferase
VDNLRERVWRYFQDKGYTLDLIPHDHAFGSGGDFLKTMHATTSASIVVAPLMTMCKTGTTNVTSLHGSYQAMTELGYNQISVKPYLLKDLLVKYNFAFISLGDMGFPYSDVLKKARKKLWYKNLDEINYRYRPEENNWQEVVKNLNIPQVIDIFKIVAPNAQVLNPVHHSTGVCHLKMIPYIIGIYLHLSSSGIICHCYDGIDEVSNASVNLLGNNPNNLIVKIDSENITIAEFLPEDIGLERVSMEEIKEEKLLKEEINIFWQILAGKKEYFKSKRDFIVANAALLLVAGNKVSNVDEDIVSQLREGVSIAENLIDSGKSYSNFSQLLLELHNQYA